MATGHEVRSQIPLTSGERIDLLVDETVGIEVNGKENHLTTFERDHRKGAVIVTNGYHGLRATARMVFDDWELVEAMVEAALAMHIPFGNSGGGGRLRRRIPGSMRRRRRRT